MDAAKLSKEQKAASSGESAVAQKSDKPYYRAGHWVRPSTAKQVRKPATGVAIVAALLAIAAWNTVFGDDSEAPVPAPQQSAPSASATP
ncbi:hypothetical protein [Streptomyces erythrochromogenes]|uniref:hypothetical protein n=1 Tax=Streptomyces erythrochromogenes TaxID=285574 RepID=UPI0037F9E782